ncbi:MAG: SRPBCC family protein [Deltaproteobacteria bacterium]|nr:SRPBCC family protein [Kofleriaceae bacterium]
MPPSFQHQLSIELPVPPADVWAVIADYRRDPEWRAAVEMTVEPAGLVTEGAVTDERLRALGSWTRTTARIRDVVPGRSFRFVSDDGAVEGRRAVEGTDGGSRLTVWLRVTLPRAMAPLARFMGWMFRHRVRRDLARLRRVVMTRVAGA